MCPPLSKIIVLATVVERLTAVHERTAVTLAAVDLSTTVARTMIYVPH